MVDESVDNIEPDETCSVSIEVINLGPSYAIYEDGFINVFGKGDLLGQLTKYMSTDVEVKSLEVISAEVADVLNWNKVLKILSGRVSHMTNDLWFELRENLKFSKYI